MKKFYERHEALFDGIIAAVLIVFALASFALIFLLWGRDSTGYERDQIHDRLVECKEQLNGPN